MLLKKEYEVHGIIRRVSFFDIQRVGYLYVNELVEDMHKDKKVKLYYGNLTEFMSLIRVKKFNQQRCMT